MFVATTATAFDGHRGLALMQRRLHGVNAAESMVADASARPLGTDRLVANLQAKLKQRLDDARALTQLGGVYYQKARETGDPS